MKTFEKLIEESLHEITEVMPWDLRDELNDKKCMPLLLDVREPDEFAAMHIAGSLHVPRGVLESACEFGYEETEPRLARARDKDVVVICRSGRRSALAARTMQMLGFKHVRSLRLGLRGWNDDGGELTDGTGNDVDPEVADEFFRAKLRPDQLG